VSGSHGATDASDDPAADPDLDDTLVRAIEEPPLSPWIDNCVPEDWDTVSADELDAILRRLVR
jgi:hypothetical protein